MNGFKISPIESPCGKECADRFFGCRETCGKWSEYEVKKREYYEYMRSCDNTRFVTGTPAFLARQRRRQRNEAAGKWKY